MIVNIVKYTLKELTLFEINKCIASIIKKIQSGLTKIRLPAGVAGIVLKDGTKITGNSAFNLRKKYDQFIWKY